LSACGVVSFHEPQALLTSSFSFLALECSGNLPASFRQSISFPPEATQSRPRHTKGKPATQNEGGREGRGRTWNGTCLPVQPCDTLPYLLRPIQISLRDFNQSSLPFPPLDSSMKSVCLGFFFPPSSMHACLSSPLTVETLPPFLAGLSLSSRQPACPLAGLPASPHGMVYKIRSDRSIHCMQCLAAAETSDVVCFLPVCLGLENMGCVIGCADEEKNG